MPKKDLIEKPISADLENIISDKTAFKSSGGKRVTIVDGMDKYSAGVVVPIVSEGDAIGTIVFMMNEGETPGEVESKLAETAATFLGKHMEG